MVSREQQLLRQMMYRSGVFLLLGLVILLLTLLMNRTLGSDRSVVESLLAEGINIAAWVSLWEALATFLVDWFPYRSQIRLFRKLARAKLVFR